MIENSPSNIVIFWLPGCVGQEGCGQLPHYHLQKWYSACNILDALCTCCLPSRLPYCPCIIARCSHFPSKLPYCPHITSWCSYFPSKLPYCPHITSWCSYFPSKLPYCPRITSSCGRLSLHIFLLIAVSHVFACCHTLGHICYMMSLMVIHQCCHCISEYVQDLLLIFHWHASQACFNVYRLIARLVFREHSPKNAFFIRTIVDLIDCHRQSRQLFFMQVFLLHWKFKKSVIVLHFTKILTDHQRIWTRYIYQWYS